MGNKCRWQFWSHYGENASNFGPQIPGFACDRGGGYRTVEEYSPRAVVIDCSAMPDFEHTALNMLSEAEQRLRKEGVSLSLASLNPEPLQLIRKSKLGETVGRQRRHFNLEEAVRTLQAESVYSKPSDTARRLDPPPANKTL
jgi:STAS domain-containing protein